MNRLSRKEIIEQLKDSYKRHKNCEHCDEWASSLLFEIGELLEEVKE